MAPPADGIPAPLEGDADEVVWALQTSATLWSRGDKADALVWLRRAAEAAIDAAAVERGTELARAASHLEREMGARRSRAELPRTGGSAPPPRASLASASHLPGAKAAAVLSALEASAGTPVDPWADGDAPPRLPRRSQVFDEGLAAPPAAEHFDAEEIVTSAPVLGREDDVAIDVHVESLPPDAVLEDEASGNDPLLGDEPRSTEPGVMPTTRPGAGSDRPEVPPLRATSDDAARLTPRVDVFAPTVPPPAPDAPAPPVVVMAPRPPAVSPRPTVPPRPAPRVPGAPPPLPSRRPVPPKVPAKENSAETVRPAVGVDAMFAAETVRPLAPYDGPDLPPSPQTPAPAPEAAPAPPAPPPASPPPAPVASPAPIASPAPERRMTRTAPLPPPLAPAPPLAPTPPPAPAPAPPPEPAAAEVDSIPPLAPSVLEAVAELSDLPDDERDQFARRATVRTLQRDEEVGAFSLALVLRGAVDVCATIADTPALRLEAGSILRSRGSLDAAVPLRLVCAGEDAEVATWDEAQVEAALAPCPWVEEELRRTADRAMALAGSTLGLLGERLDEHLRRDIARLLDVRALHPGDALVRAGEPIPGIVILGAGALAVSGEGASATTLTPGDFLYRSEVLGREPSPVSAVAGPQGALVLVAERKHVQELVVTCPPLLEILAGA